MSNAWAELFPAGQFLVISSLWFETSPRMVGSLSPLGNFLAAYQLLLKIYVTIHLQQSCPIAPVPQLSAPVFPPQ